MQPQSILPLYFNIRLLTCDTVCSVAVVPTSTLKNSLAAKFI